MYILNKENQEFARNTFTEAIDIGMNFKLQENVLGESMNDADLHSFLEELPVNGQEIKELLQLFQREVIPKSSNFASENFMGFPDSGNAISSITGAILSDFMQQNIINASFCAPVATFMEASVISWLREILGYSNIEMKGIQSVGGIITPGGTLSNSVALMLARENHRKNTLIRGVTNPESYKVIVPEGIDHYSIRCAQMWLGLGNNIVRVKTQDYMYDIDALEKALADNKNQVMCVVAYAGDSRTQTIDNLEGISKLVKRIDNNIWLHADACHGFSLAFSEALKTRLAGIEQFDSISTDPHKVLFTPYVISALLVKNPKHLEMIMTDSDLITKEQFAFGKITPFVGSKNWMSLKLWFLIKNLGIKGIGKIIDKRVEMAEYLHQSLSNSKQFIVLNDVGINSVMFLYVGDKQNVNLSIEEINKINISIYNALKVEGKYYLHQFPITDDKRMVSEKELVYPLRFMSGNPNLKKQDLDQLILYLIDLCQKVEEAEVEGGVIIGH